MINFFLVMLCLISVVSCSSLSNHGPGVTNVSKSDFDGSIHVKMLPGWVGHSIRIGLRKNSSMKKDEVIIDIVVSHQDSIERVQFNIDGEIHTLTKATSKLSTKEFVSGIYLSGTDTYIPGYIKTKKSYYTTMEFVENISTAKKSLIKVFLSNSFLEGNVSKGGPSTAKDGFNKFLLKARGVETEKINK